MLEGLALWALIIFLLVKMGMPWNKMTQIGSVVGGTFWLVFVWIGMISWSPMDITGGSVVQSPHIQLKPVSNDIKGEMTELYVKPNQKVTKGQKIYSLDTTVFENQLEKVNNQIIIAKGRIEIAENNLMIANTLKSNAELAIKSTESEIVNKETDVNFFERKYKRLLEQNSNAKGTVSEFDLDEAFSKLTYKREELNSLSIKKVAKIAEEQQASVNVRKEELNIAEKINDINTYKNDKSLLKWKIENSTIYAPEDGFLTNFIAREGQFIGQVPRIHMYTEEKYILVRINHQGLRNIKSGQYSEFATSVYPGHIFQAEVEAVVEATGEAQGSLLGFDNSVRTTTIKNANNKHHFVRIKILEDGDYDIPLGSSGIAWISAEKPSTHLAFLDVIRGIIIRLKSQIFYVYN